MFKNILQELSGYICIPNDVKNIIVRDDHLSATLLVAIEHTTGHTGVLFINDYKEIVTAVENYLHPKNRL